MCVSIYRLLIFCTSRNLTEIRRRKTAKTTAAGVATAASASTTLLHLRPNSATVNINRAQGQAHQQHVRSGRWRVVGQQAAQAQTSEHGRRGRVDPPTVPATVRTAPTAVRARVCRTSPARLVVADAIHAHVAVRTNPVVGALRSGRGKP